MGQSKIKETFPAKKKRLLRHLSKLSTALAPALDYAFDRYFEEQAMTYLNMEERLDCFEGLILKLHEQLTDAETLSALERVAGRLSYVADEVDRLEAIIYRRRRRRVRFDFNLSDFFKASQNNQNGFSSPGEARSSLSEAYQTLGLEEGCSLYQVTTAFRRLAKQYHPDARGGDRSDERHLRQVLAAYQLLKESLQD